MNNKKKRIFDIIQIGYAGDVASRTFDIAITAAIIINLFIAIFDTFEQSITYQPEVFKNAFSGIWWSVSTVLTVGYGDIYPLTLLGKCMAIVIAFMGVLLVAIPTGIISAGFVEQYQTNANEDSKFVDVDEIGEVMVTEGSKFMGRTVSSASDEYGVSIYMVLRDKMSVLPTGDLVIEMGDILIIRSKTLEKRSCRRR